MNDTLRAAEAHRASFALITGALSDPHNFDPELLIKHYIIDAADPSQTLIDIAHALVWHSAGALLTVANDDIPAALKIVRKAALMQETTERESNE